MARNKNTARRDGKKKKRNHSQNNPSSPAMSTPRPTNPPNSAKPQTIHPTTSSILKKPTDPAQPKTLNPKSPTGPHKTEYENENPDSSSTDSHQSTLDREGPEFDTDEEEWRKSVFHKHAHWSRQNNMMDNPAAVSAVQKLKGAKAEGGAASISEIVSGAVGDGGAEKSKAKDKKELIEIKKENAEHKEKRKRDYDMFHHLNSPSFFKPPPSSLSLWGDKEKSKERENDIKHGRGVFKKWDGIEE